MIAVDLGSRRIGLAVSDAARTMAFPRPLLERRRDRAADHQAIRHLVEETGATVVVVGLPLTLAGHRGPAARDAEEEAVQLATALAGTGVEVVTFDERLTTVSASSALAEAGRRERDRRRAVDSAAATVLLSAWLASEQR